MPILLLLAGCGGENEVPDGDEPAPPAEAGALELPVPAAGEDPVKLQDLIRRAMVSALPDAEGARYRNLRPGVGGAACGEVATAGPFRPFVVTPDSLAVIASGPAIAFDDPSDFFADAWIRWCATPEELAKLGPQLRQAAERPPVDAELPPAAEPPVDIAGPAPPPRSPPKAKAPTEPPRIDSFFNSVQRD